MEGSGSRQFCHVVLVRASAEISCRSNVPVFIVEEFVLTRVFF